jgi:hypothetical protein
MRWTIEIALHQYKEQPPLRQEPDAGVIHSLPESSELTCVEMANYGGAECPWSGTCLCSWKATRDLKIEVKGAPSDVNLGPARVNLASSAIELIGCRIN